MVLSLIVVVEARWLELPQGSPVENIGSLIGLAVVQVVGLACALHGLAYGPSVATAFGVLVAMKFAGSYVLFVPLMRTHQTGAAAGVWSPWRQLALGFCAGLAILSPLIIAVIAAGLIVI